jgi:hypothetical protein
MWQATANHIGFYFNGDKIGHFHYDDIVERRSNLEHLVLCVVLLQHGYQLRVQVNLQAVKP